jgi:hypothetical protein
MTGLRQLAACVLVAAPVAGLTLLDPVLGAGAVGGAAAAVLVLFFRIPREAPREFRVIPLVAAPVEKRADARAGEQHRVRHPGSLHLETGRFITVEDSRLWETLT